MNTGHLYVGDFMNDRKHGKGEFRWASGNFYRGVFREDKREGVGMM